MSILPTWFIGSVKMLLMSLWSQSLHPSLHYDMMFILFPDPICSKIDDKAGYALGCGCHGSSSQLHPLQIWSPPVAQIWNADWKKKMPTSWPEILFHKSLGDVTLATLPDLLLLTHHFPFQRPVWKGGWAERWSDKEKKKEKGFTLFISRPSLPPHLPCLSRLVVTVDRPLSASGEKNRIVCTEERMGTFNELENLWL